MGGVALLLWGMHMVQSGVLRAAGADLRRLLAAGLRSRWHAFAAGLGVTALLQSSTATLLMATSFAASGMVELAWVCQTRAASLGSAAMISVASFSAATSAP